jgi:hypothetical protein
MRVVLDDETVVIIDREKDDCRLAGNHHARLTADHATRR